MEWFLGGEPDERPVVPAAMAVLGEVVHAGEAAHARVSQETRLDEYGLIPREDRTRVESMVEGFVDAAVQAPPGELPKVRGAVFVAPGSSAGTAGLGSLVASRIRLRLGGYPPDAVAVSAEQLLAQVSISAIARPGDDPQIGVVQVQVEGQRRLTGLYGPVAYSQPDDPLPRHRTMFVRACEDLASLPEGDPVFARAGEIMNRHHQPPHVFVEREPARVHQAHRERHRATTDLVAWELLRNSDDAAIERARDLVPRRGCPGEAVSWVALREVLGLWRRARASHRGPRNPGRWSKWRRGCRTVLRCRGCGSG